ncbi:hypothetical protein [Croceicoccus marinus]|uniref:Uncharacterized protein n=1 Tax=Croceicoccus marinus TaxID=450378 RepID=A0A7G6VTJ6_9SPHN|nr:hypothetical protein [Croceicoccus marinus]QNE05061.1 hypothetical protein H4O24_14365 [Croceicoccus marinus]
MTAIGEPLKMRRQKRFRAAMILAMTLLAITVVAAIWLAFTADAPTEIATDPETGALIVSGPEQDFVGRVDGRIRGQDVSVLGLPAYHALAENAEALARVCALRDDPAARWSEGSETLRAHLNSPEMIRYCRDGP